MSNIAGKAYAMNLVTPLARLTVLAQKLVFWAVGTRYFAPRLNGLLTLSMIHYARWVILRDADFPRLSVEQPKEKLRYGYMLFFSNFNGSWEQYVDSFSAAIPSGLDLLWRKNVGWPTAVPEQPFHRYVEYNQVWTDYYYNAYPMAASNDVKAAQRVKDRLLQMVAESEGATPIEFVTQYHALLKDLQADLSPMDATPIVSLAAEDIEARKRGKTHSENRKETEAEVASWRVQSGLASDPSNDTNSKKETRSA
ncbi:MAG TPA: hypothetical protein VFX59_10920 [Polyangiales bacterium]|nr:hypothetical protein [Polyangiales bacterium]